MRQKFGARFVSFGVHFQGARKHPSKDHILVKKTWLRKDTGPGIGTCHGSQSNSPKGPSCLLSFGIMIRHPTGLRRTDWPLQQKPQVVLVELGANDGLRGIDVQGIESNLRRILKRFRTAGADAIKE